MHIGQVQNKVCTEAHTNYGLNRSNIRIVPPMQMVLLPKPSLQDTYRGCGTVGLTVSWMYQPISLNRCNGFQTLVA